MQLTVNSGNPEFMHFARLDKIALSDMADVQAVAEGSSPFHHSPTQEFVSGSNSKTLAPF